MTPYGGNNLVAPRDASPSCSFDGHANGGRTNSMPMPTAAAAVAAAAAAASMIIHRVGRLIPTCLRPRIGQWRQRQIWYVLSILTLRSSTLVGGGTRLSTTTLVVGGYWGGWSRGRGRNASCGQQSCLRHARMMHNDCSRVGQGYPLTGTAAYRNRRSVFFSIFSFFPSF
jgi:hypothetical protein